MPGTVDIGAVGAGRLCVIVRYFETSAANEEFLAFVKVEVPEPGVLESHAFDQNVLRILDQGEARARQPEVRKLIGIRRAIAHFPEQVPDRSAILIRPGAAGDAQPVAAVGMEQRGGEARLEMPLD